MGSETNIEWTNKTFNPWRGCVEISPGCAHCYARELSKRNPKTLGVWGGDVKGGVRVVGARNYWFEPLKWNQQAEQQGIRFKVFCSSLADVFEDWEGPMVSTKGDQLSATMHDVRQWLFDLIDQTPFLDWQLVTKRPENILGMWPETGEGFESGGQQGWVANDYRPNVWLLTTTENQEQADKRIPELIKCRDLVPVLGLSCEPLLGPIDLTEIPNGNRHSYTGVLDNQIDWLIAGGESGPHARPMHPDWVRALRDHCTDAAVPFFFKQWGEWLPEDHVSGAYDWRKANENPKAYVHCWSDTLSSVKVGKKAACRELDSREWSEFPQSSAAE